MASSRKKEYPPLLPAGFHVMTVAEVRALCVDRFPLSKKRDEIMTKLETVIDKLRRDRIEGEVWVDGSFLTEKINPKDSDILLHVQADYYDNATLEQQMAIDWVNSNLALRCLKWVTGLQSLQINALEG